MGLAAPVGWRDSVGGSDGLMVIISSGRPSSGQSSAVPAVIRQVMSPPTLREGSRLRGDAGLSEASLLAQAYFVFLLSEAEAVLISLDKHFLA